jgi:5-methylcytosine-specific restriction enzyme A
MGKLRQLKSGLAPLPRLISFVDDTKAAQSRTRDRRHEWRAWYKTKQWRQLRWSVLMRDLFTCQMCGRIEADTSQLVADHKVPHCGDEALFWNVGNIQCLCKPCHDGAKQREEAAARPTRWA